MPVPYSEVPYKQLMCHQGAYDLIDLAGRKNISRWDIKEFEKFSLNAPIMAFWSTLNAFAKLLDK